MTDFEMFKDGFSSWTDRLLENWAREKGVSKPPLHIVPEEKLDPWEVGFIYVLPGWRHSGILGPSIICPERYLRDLYDGAVRRDKMKELWNILEWKLGHEMGHHLQYVKTYRVTLPRSPLVREALRRSEIRASLRAFRLVGKTKQQQRRDFLRVTGKVPLRYVVETARKKWKY